jgi:hypothetical protein
MLTRSMASKGSTGYTASATSTGSTSSTGPLGHGKRHGLNGNDGKGHGFYGFDFKFNELTVSTVNFTGSSASTLM